MAAGAISWGYSEYRLATINDVLGEDVHVSSALPSRDPKPEATLSAEVKKGSFEVPEKLEEELAFLERAVGSAS